MTTLADTNTTQEHTYDIPKECWAGVVKNEGPGESRSVRTLRDLVGKAGGCVLICMIQILKSRSRKCLCQRLVCSAHCLRPLLLY